MNTLKTGTSLFAKLSFILFETSHPGNVGASARAIKTMGFSRLVLVNPRFPDILEHEEAIAFASGAQDVLKSAQIVSTIDEALTDCQLAAALSARLREFSPPVMLPREFAGYFVHGATLSHPIQAALVFGSERHGLPNEVVGKCHALISIPGNPAYNSLNLAQAIQILAYECHLALAGAALPPTGIGFHGKAASVTQIEKMYGHLEEALIQIEYLNPHTPKKLFPRLRRMLARNNLEAEEVNILHGIAKQILYKMKSR